MKTLETKRLILRDWEITDLDDYFAFKSNPNVTMPEGDLPKRYKEECLPELKYLIGAKNNYALVLKEEGKVIGSVGLNEDADGNENARNVGFMLDESYWNKGLMTEALIEIIANAYKITPCLSCVHSAGNTRTKHIIKKLGFIYVKTFPNIKKESDMNSQDYLYWLLELNG
jgi:Acetyltransferases, including N-acetylases of ribosomal proteins